MEHCDISTTQNTLPTRASLRGDLTGAVQEAEGRLRWLAEASICWRQPVSGLVKPHTAATGDLLGVHGKEKVYASIP